MPENENENVHVGTKELEEAIVGVLETGVVAFTEFKDGFDFGDIARIVGNDEWQEAMSAALKGMSAIPAEARDLSAEEITDNIVPLVVNWVKNRLLPALGVDEDVLSGDGSGDPLPDAD